MIHVSRTHLLCGTRPQASELPPVFSAADTVPPRTLPQFFRTAPESLQRPQSAAAPQKLSEFGL